MGDRIMENALISNEVCHDTEKLLTSWYFLGEIDNLMNKY